MIYRIIVDYGCLYGLNGSVSSVNDEFDSRIIINGVTVARRYQKWLAGGDGAGTGTRGSTLFPITGGVSNASLGAPGARNIKIVIRRYAHYRNWRVNDSIAFHYFVAFHLHNSFSSSLIGRPFRNTGFL